MPNRKSSSDIFLPCRSSQRHFQRQPWPSECLFMLVQAGCGSHLFPLSLLPIYSYVPFLHFTPIVTCSNLRDKPLLSLHITQWVTLVRNKWHMMHFRLLEMDLSHIFPEWPALSVARVVQNVNFRASDVDVLALGYIKMLFFYIHR